MSERHLSTDDLVKMIRDISGTIVAGAVEESMQKALKPLERQHTELLARALADPAKQAEAESATRFGRLVRAIGTAALNQKRMQGPSNPADVLNQWGDKSIADIYAKAMSSSIGSEGGHLIPTQLSSDVIEFLRPASIVRRLNPTTIPMPNGNLRIPKVTGGSSASYQGENQNIAQTQLVVGQIALTFKKLTALVPASNDLLRYSGPGAASADAMIRDDVVRAIAQRENQAFLRDDGTVSTPKGIKNWAVAGNIANSAGTSLANMVTDLGVAILALMNNNIPEGRWAWMFSPRTWNSFMTIQNTNGFFVFRDEMSRGTLWGYPFAFTTQMPGSGATGEMYLVNMSDAIIGDSMALQVDVSMEASYVDATSGSLVSAYSLDQSIVRAITEHDFAMRRGESVAVIQAMSY